MKNQEQEFQFQRLLESSIDGFWETNMEGQICSANRAACEMLGYTAEEMIGMHISVIETDETSEDIDKHIHKNAEHIHDRFHSHHRCKNGDILDVEVSLQYLPVDGGRNFCFTRNLTSQKKIARDLKESEAYADLIYNSSSDPMFLMSVEPNKVFRCLSVNQSYLNKTGQSREQLIGKPIDEILSGEALCVALKGHDDAIKQGHPIQYEESVDLTIGHLVVETTMTPVFNDAGICTHLLGSARDITERRKAENILIDSQKRLGAILESITDGFVAFDAELNYTYINKRGAELFGLQPSDLIGKNYWKEFPESKGTPFANAYVKTLETRAPVIFEDYYEPWDRWFENRIYPTEEGIAIYYSEITERKRIEVELKNSEIRFMQVAECSGVWIWEVNTEGQYTFVSPSEESVLGYSPEELVGKKYFYDFFESHQKETLKTAAFEVFSRKESFFEFENSNIHKDGRIIILETSGVPILDSEGKLLGYRGADRNITRQKQAEAELVAAKEIAIESNLLKSSFLQNMSHEIRTPMNAIMGFTDLMREAEGETKYKFAGIIQKSANQLLTLLDDVMFVSRVQNEQLPLLNSWFKPSAILTDVYHIFDLPKLKKNLEIYLDIPEKYKELSIYSDLEKVKQIMTILMSNAAKYTLQGSITLGFSLVDHDIEFFVKDTGIGIPEHEQEKIFDTFYRGELAIHNAIGGTGLGLNIAKAMIDLMGGNIRLVSTPGEGSAFHFSFPQEKPPRIEADHHHEPVDEMFWKDAMILIAEDEPNNYLYLEIILKNKVKRLDHAWNGQEAIDLASANHYDMVLMDIKMPKLDGIKATKQLRQEQSELIIIAQTAYVNPEEKTFMFESGFTDLISKPVRKQDLFELIDKYIGR
ncbi:MAG: PAS domain S-box protein [Bacteroidota bacterium]